MLAYAPRQNRPIVAMEDQPLTTPQEVVLAQLNQIVGASHVLTSADELLRFGRDWTRLHDPAPCAIVLPATVEEVQQLVCFALEQKLSIVPSGGRTGLSGGAVAASGELVLALDRLNQIGQFNDIDRTVACGAGVITQQLQAFALDQGLYYPVDFASSGSSQIGGNIATNAGGIKVIRYGMTRDWVAGLKLVTGSGELLELNRGLIKNNAAYDLRHLVIGSEGTLGIIVEADMRLCRPPKDLSVMVLGVSSMQSLLRVLATFQGSMQLNAFEFFSELALQKVVAHTNLQRPFADAAPFYALLEFEQTQPAVMALAMELFEHCVGQGWVSDGVVSQSTSQAATLWRLREDISETISRWSPYKNDLSTTVSQLPQFLAEVDDIVGRSYPDFEIVWYGHIGDGNVHLNILKPDNLPQEEFQARCAQVSTWVFEIVQRYGGSISAEHGVGLLKRDYLSYSRSTVEIELMRQIKQVFDPQGIMNPGKVFPESL